MIDPAPNTTMPRAPAPPPVGAVEDGLPDGWAWLDSIIAPVDENVVAATDEHGPERRRPALDEL